MLQSKKIRILVVCFLFTFLIITLNFIKLPINYLASKKIDTKKESLILLKDIESQSLKLLPLPMLEIKNALIHIDLDLVKYDLNIPNLEISRTFFNKNNIFININEASLKNIQMNILKNPYPFEYNIEKLKINIFKEGENYEIKTTTFEISDTELAFNLQLKNKSLKKLSFLFRNLDMNELSLFLNENTQNYLKIFDSPILDAQGEYTDNYIDLEKFVLDIDGYSSITMKGNLNLNALSKSELSVRGTNFNNKKFFELLANFNFNISKTNFDLHYLNNDNFTFYTNFNSNNIIINKEGGYGDFNEIYIPLKNKIW